MLPQIIWTKCFLEEQHCNIDEHRIVRDNQSAMLLESNGKASSSKRTKHINVRFFLKDYLQDNKNNIAIEYCQTKEMIADFFTKRSQGYDFKKLRALIMGSGEIL